MLLLLALLACRDGAAATADLPARTVTAELLDVRADVGIRDDRTRWSVRYWPSARIPATVRALPEGRCERVDTSVHPRPQEAAHAPDRVRVLGGLRATLAPQRVHDAGGPERQAPETHGPAGARTSWAATVEVANDPAWSVLDLRREWHEGQGASDTRTSAIRMGPAPEVNEVARRPDGSVYLSWSEGSVDEVRVVTEATAGSMHCGAGPTGVTLPWWSVPARGGEVVIESTRVHGSGPTGAMRVTRATIARHVRLDVAPPATRATGAPLPRQERAPRERRRTTPTPRG